MFTLVGQCWVFAASIYIYIYICILADIPVVGQHLMYRIGGTHGLRVLLCRVLSDFFFIYHNHMHHKTPYHC